MLLLLPYNSKSNCACIMPSIPPCVCACLTGEMPELKGMKLCTKFLLCGIIVNAWWVSPNLFMFAKLPTTKLPWNKAGLSVMAPTVQDGFQRLGVIYWWKLHQQHCLDTSAKFQLILSEKQFLKQGRPGCCHPLCRMGFKGLILLTVSAHEWCFWGELRARNESMAKRKNLGSSWDSNPKTEY